MTMTSAAESKLNARIRPDIAAMRSRTSYPKRRLAVVPDTGASHQANGLGADGAPFPALTSRTHGSADPAPEATVGGGPGEGESAAQVTAVQVTAVQVIAAQVTAASGRPGGAGAAKMPAKGAHAAPRRRSPAAAPIRLTRRGRIVVCLAAVLGVIAVAGLIWILVAGQARAAGHVRPGTSGSGGLERVVVRQGQTLWMIATAADPSADPRVVIQEIVNQNGLSGTSIQVGQVLWVPRG